MAKLTEQKIAEAADWVRKNGLMEHGGAKLKDFCKAMSISHECYYNWMQREIEFSAAIKKAKEQFKKQLEIDIVKSLARSATGYDYEQTTKEYRGDGSAGKLIKKVVKTVHVEPNVGAGIFLLTNLNPRDWKNKQQNDITVDTEQDNSIQVEIIDKREQIDGNGA